MNQIPLRPGPGIDHDPHPANEENYDRIPNPGGTPRRSDKDIGTNNAVHDGRPKKRPKNAEND